MLWGGKENLFLESLQALVCSSSYCMHWTFCVCQISWSGTELCAMSPVNRDRSRRYVLNFDLSGARVQAMNTLTLVEETGAHTRWTYIHIQFNLTQPPFTVSLQGGVQWLEMVCSEWVHVSFNVFTQCVDQQHMWSVMVFKSNKNSVKMDRFLVVCVSACALPLVSANVWVPLLLLWQQSLYESLHIVISLLRSEIQSWNRNGSGCVCACMQWTEFKSFESCRQLCSSFDVFLADSCVYHSLHGILGKSFYARKK